MRGAGHRRDARAGYALVEVTLALLLIAILAALALPGLVRATGAGTLRMAAMQATALLRNDRNVALSAGRSIATYVEGGRHVRSGATSAVVDMPAGAEAGIEGDAIRFFADGRSSGGQLVLASETARYVISVNPDTGAIRVAMP